MIRQTTITAVTFKSDAPIMNTTQRKGNRSPLLIPPPCDLSRIRSKRYNPNAVNRIPNMICMTPTILYTRLLHRSNSLSG